MNPAQMGNNQMAGMVQPMGPGINPNNMMNSQAGQIPPSQIAQSQQAGIGGIIGQTSGGSGGGVMQQTGRITPASMVPQGSGGGGGGMINQTAGNMLPQANRTMAPTPMMQPQQPTGMVPQGMNSGGVPGIQQQGVPGIQQQNVPGGQQAMFPGNQQFGGMSQNFGGGYGSQGMPQQPNLQQNMQMGNFNQMNAQRSQAEFLAQQQRNLQQQQQQAANQQQVQANRGQFTQQVPNVTMNQGMNQGMNTMVGQAPPYPRQQPAGATPQQQQLFQQSQQQHRLRQQQLLMQQQQAQQQQQQQMGN